MRLDIYLAEKGLAKSRERAKELIKASQVTVNGKAASKPALEVSEGDEVKIIGEQLKYVGRGGLKLEKAIEHFGISLTGRVCIDIGASTGGFTDCMLQNGAAYVYAVDVGHDQLDGKLAEDSRVANMERTNIKDLSREDFPKAPDFISADVSFVSLTQIIPKIKEFLPEGGEAAVLIKPQFEAGRSAVGKNGIVKDRKVHERVLEDMVSFCFSRGLSVAALTFSPISGGDGNIEYLAHLKNTAESFRSFDCKKIVSEAFSCLR
ncbi:MAG: TlyA family RNA methyltransferase [Oscillospiraceae bacterium]|nr:TlyA family RNA methyltransferase [Oscillospiraceae bacterium]